MNPSGQILSRIISNVETPRWGVSSTRSKCITIAHCGRSKTPHRGVSTDGVLETSDYDTISTQQAQRSLAWLFSMVCILALRVLLAEGAYAQRVVQLPDATKSASLKARWEAATEQARRESASGFWMAYSTERLMEARSFIGSWSSDGLQRTSLSMLVYGREVEPRNRDLERGGVSMLVLKEVVFLVRYGSGQAPADVDVSNISLAVELDGLPLYWLGKAGAAESITQMQMIYGQARDEEAQEGALTAVALHKDEPAALDFLIGVMEGDASESVREKATFWLGQQSDPRALAALRKTMQEDRSIEVREQAVFAISQMDTPEATDLLIDAARREKHIEVRKKAVFWLGQKASKRVVEVLEDILEEDGDTEVQKQALMALSQMEDVERVPALIRVARTHPNVHVRKQAIYLLSDSDDPRALETLIELATMGDGSR